MILSIYDREINQCRIRLSNPSLGLLFRAYGKSDFRFDEFDAIIRELDIIHDKNLSTPNHSAYEIFYGGPIGVLVTSSHSRDRFRLHNLQDFPLCEIWNFRVDVKNWQKEDFPQYFLEYGVDPRVILHLILKTWIK